MPNLRNNSLENKTKQKIISVIDTALVRNESNEKTKEFKTNINYISITQKENRDVFLCSLECKIRLIH